MVVDIHVLAVVFKLREFSLCVVKPPFIKHRIMYYLVVVVATATVQPFFCVKYSPKLDIHISSTPARTRKLFWLIQLIQLGIENQK